MSQPRNLPISDHTCDAHQDREAVSRLDVAASVMLADGVTVDQLYCCEDCSPSLSHLTSAS